MASSSTRIDSQETERPSGHTRGQTARRRDQSDEGGMYGDGTGPGPQGNTPPPPEEEEDQEDVHEMDDAAIQEEL